MSRHDKCRVNRKDSHNSRLRAKINKKREKKVSHYEHKMSHVADETQVFFSLFLIRYAGACDSLCIRLQVAEEKIDFFSCSFCQLISDILRENDV